MKFVGLIIALLLSLDTFSNGGEKTAVRMVSGTVIESGTTEELSGVRVSVPGTDIFTFTDKEGNFELTNVPGGQITLQFSLVSFEKTSFTISSETAVLTSPLNIQLEPR